jgi:hypothetical protein
MDQTARLQQTLHKRAASGERFAENQAGLGLDQATTSVPHPTTTALLQLAASAATRPLGCSEVSPRLQWIRGPYLMGEGLAAYYQHLGLATARRRS